jgi:hypothetical protein
VAIPIIKDSFSVAQEFGDIQWRCPALVFRLRINPLIQDCFDNLDVAVERSVMEHGSPT